MLMYDVEGWDRIERIGTILKSVDIRVENIRIMSNQDIYIYLDHNDMYKLDEYIILPFRNLGKVCEIRISGDKYTQFLNLFL